MGEDAVQRFPAQVEPLTVVFQAFSHAQALLIVAKAAGQQAVERAFPDMAERRMPQIVPQGGGFGQVLVEAQAARQRAGHLGYLQRMGQAGAVMVAHGSEKHLRLVFQPAKALAVNDAVAVALVAGAQVAGGNGVGPPGASGGQCSVRGQAGLFVPLLTLTDGHAAGSFHPWYTMES